MITRTQTSISSKISESAISDISKLSYNLNYERDNTAIRNIQVNVFGEDKQQVAYVHLSDSEQNKLITLFNNDYTLYAPIAKEIDEIIAQIKKAAV